MNGYLVLRSRYYQELQHNAELFYGGGRMSQNVSGHGRNMFITHDCSNNDLFNKEDPKLLLEQCIGHYDEGQVFKRDQAYLKKWLEHPIENLLTLKLTDGNNLVQDLMLGGTTLVNLLKVDMYSNMFSWQFPPKSDIKDMCSDPHTNYLTASNYAVKEITVGRSSPTEINSFSDWFWNQFKDQGKQSLFSVVAFNVHYICVPKNAFELLCNRIKTKNPTPVLVEAFEKCKTEVLLPARITLGGKNWLASIKFNITEAFSTPAHAYLLHTHVIQSELIDLLEGLPILFGEDVATLKDSVKCTISRLYQVNINLPDVLDIKTLAAFSGWILPDTSLFSISLITLGELLNTVAGEADGHWALQWEHLFKEFQLYAIGISRSLYRILVTMMTLTMRHLFPDPEVMCNLLELNQEDTFNYLTSVVISLLKNKFTTQTSKHSRKDIVKSLLPLDSSDADVKLINSLSKLIPDWSTVPYGGARYLHTCRLFGIQQYSVLKEIDYHHQLLAPNLSKNLTADEKTHIMFRRELEHKELDEPCQNFGLQANPEFVHDCLVLNPYTASDSEILGISAYCRASRILEWGRTHVYLIDMMMRRLNQIADKGLTDNFWFKNTTIYEGLRLIHKRIAIVHTYKVQAVEKVIQQRRERDNSDAERLARKREGSSVNHATNAKLRKDLFSVIKSEERCLPRTSQHQQVYAKVPGDNRERNRKWLAKRKARKAAVKAKACYIPPEEFKKLKDTVANEINSKKLPKDDLRAKVLMKVARSNHGDCTSNSKSAHGKDGKSENDDSADNHMKRNWKNY